MSHAKFEDRLGPFLDDELNPDEAREVAGHLRECGVCRTRAEELRDLSRAIRQMERFPMPADLKENLVARAGGSMEASDKLPGFWRRPFVLATLGASAIVVFAIFVLPSGGPVEPLVGGRDKEVAEFRQEPAPEPPPPVTTTGGKSASGESDPASVTETSSRKARSPQPAVTEERVAPEKRSSLHDSRDDQPADIIGRSDDQAKNSFTGDVAAGKSALASGPASTLTVARFETYLIEQGTAMPQLGPIVPADIDADAPRRNAPAERMEAPSPAATAIAQPEVLQATGPAGIRVTFLVRLGPDGRILSADHLGARIVSEQRVRIVQTLLTAATLPPRGPGEPSLVVIEVLLPESP